MDSERFDGFVRSFGQARTRRQTLRGLAGAGALMALLAAKPVAAGKTGQPGGSQPGNSPPGSGQNGQLGSTDSLLCGYQCNDALTDCEYACFNASSGSADPEDACYAVCLSQNDACVAACPPG